MDYYQADIHITKQEDGLWRLYVPDVKGAWVDTKTLEEGFTEIQEVIALMVAYYQERGWELPKTIKLHDGQPAISTLPILLQEYQFTPAPAHRAKDKRS